MRHLFETASLVAFVAAIAGIVSCGPEGTPPVTDGETDHFHPKGKPPSEHTIKVLQEARIDLPFEDDRDFEESERGFIAAPDSKIIMADAGHVAWDLERYDWLLEGDEFDPYSFHSWSRTKRIWPMSFRAFIGSKWKKIQSRGFPFAPVSCG